MAWIIITVVDPHGIPLEDVVLNATSPTNGPWSGKTNCAGQFIPNLAAGHYDIRLTKPGYKEYVWPTDLADCGPITQALEFESAPITRDQIINVQGNFLNLFDSDGFPIWDIYLASFYMAGNMKKFNEWLGILQAARTTHINLAISYNYNEYLDWAGGPYPLAPMDFTKDLSPFLEVVRIVRSRGFIPIIKLACDGQGFDPNGWTYGWQWGMDNMNMLANKLGEFNEQALFSTGYDGCFPNWSPDQTRQFLRKARAEFGDVACLDTEFGGPGTVGYIHMGNGPADWVPDSLGILDSFSIELNEFPPDNTGIQQVASRLLGPLATNIQPGNAGPWYLQQMNAIKKINIGMYEMCAYYAIRKRVTTAQATMGARFCNQFGYYSYGNGMP